MILVDFARQNPYIGKALHGLLGLSQSAAFLKYTTQVRTTVLQTKGV